MAYIDDLPLSVVLTKGLAEAQTLFDEDKPILAGYALFLVKQRFSSQGMMMPDEVTGLEEKITTTIRDTYPQKIRAAIEQSDDKQAMSFFYFVTRAYLHTNTPIPKEYLPIKESILKLPCAPENESVRHIFNNIYSAEKFEKE